MTWLTGCAAALTGAALLLSWGRRLARRGLGPLTAVEQFAGPAASTFEAANALADARARSEAVRAALEDRTRTAEEPH